MNIRFLGREDPLEEEMTTHSSILAGRIPWTVARQVPLSVGFPNVACWSRLPFPSPGDLSDPGIEPGSFVSPALAGEFFAIAPPGKPLSLLR